MISPALSFDLRIVNPHTVASKAIKKTARIMSATDTVKHRRCRFVIAPPQADRESPPEPPRRLLSEARGLRH